MTAPTLGSTTGSVAVVDLGSVAAKLLITDGSSRLRRTVDTLVGPSGATAATAGDLGDDALERVDGALAEFRPLIDEAGAAVRAVATAAAVRRAGNAGALARLVRDRLGVDLDLLTADDEARLGFLGVASDPCLLRPGATAGSGAGPSVTSRSVVTIDLGGGSTELVVGTAAGPDRWRSVEVGGAGVTAQYLHGDPPRPEELSAALSVVELHVDDVVRELPELAAALDGGLVVGLGAVVTIAAVEIGLADVDPRNGEGDGPLHGFELTRTAMEDVFRTLATESAADRAHNPGLPPTRVGDIVGACAVLVEMMRRLDLERLTVSQRGLADGVAARYLGRSRGQPAPDQIGRSVPTADVDH